MGDDVFADTSAFQRFPVLFKECLKACEGLI